MNNFLKKTALLFALSILSISAFAQQDQPIEMADGLYQSGKIYVVVVVASIIFLGIVAYLIMLDRKISKLEKEIKNK
ncbi:MAG: CcmD family protein [Bacteroidetes bacterium RIFCSPLOWO2_12_FULL_35_15]|nr:MAG: CcmD family protein [Bacteroidetes bacterium RIFCSPLOWO2_12_FULL_35_15]